jgi:ribosome-associated protein
MIQISGTVSIDENELSFTSARSSGPGGQHVNKVNSKVILTYPLDKIIGTSSKQEDLIREKLKSYIISEHFIRVISQKHRSQYANRLDALERLQTLLKNSLKERKRRKKTSIPRAAKEQRLQDKKKRAQIKQGRRISED